MNKDALVKELLAAGLTPEDIFGLAQEQNNREKEASKARNELLKAIYKYVEFLVPEMEITKEDKKYLSDYLKAFESNISNFANNRKKSKSTSTTDDEDRKIREFLIKLGCF